MKYLFLLIASCVSIGVQAQKKSVRFYVGTSANDQESSITLCELDVKNGIITKIDTFNACVGPGYVRLSPDQKFLYAVNQGNTIASFGVGKGGTLTYLNRQNAEGVNPCHVSVHPSGKMAFLANYTSGSWAAYPISSNGKIEASTAKYQFAGSGPNKSRQEKPHAHCVLSTPNGKFVYVTDLGTDRLMNYTVDAAKGTVSPNPIQAYFYTEPGAGPRHFIIHPSGRFLYLLNELQATLIACTIDEQGVINEIETVETLPADFKGTNSSAAIRMHPNGRFVYVSNRGYNGIHAYEIQKNGSLKKVGEIQRGISTPRDFNIDPTGQFMVIGNQDTNNLLIYEVNPATGKLSYRSESVSITKPICIEFLR
jgi:6-phosphogluconolactonase